MTTQKLSELSKDQQINALFEKLNKQQESIDLLTKAADKSRLERFKPKEDEGTIVHVSTYRKDFEDKARLVIKWELVKDDVRVNKLGIEEDQRVVITLFDNGIIQDLEDKLANTDYSKRPDLKEKVGTDLQEARKKYQIELTYKEFAITALIEQVAVNALGFTQDADGENRKVKFSFEGQEHTLSLVFINK